MLEIPVGMKMENEVQTAENAEVRNCWKVIVATPTEVLLPYPYPDSLPLPPPPRLLLSHSILLVVIIVVIRIEQMNKNNSKNNSNTINYFIFYTLNPKP